MRATPDHITAPITVLAETLIAPALHCGANCITDGHRPEYAHALNCDLHGDDAARCLTYLHTDKGRALLTAHAADRPGAVVEGLRNHLTDLFRAAGAFTHHVDKWTRTGRGRKVVHDEADRALFKVMVNATQNGHPSMYPVSADHGIGSTPWVDAASLRTEGTGWTGDGGNDDGSRERVPLTGMFGYAPAWVKTPASLEMTRGAAEYLRDQAVRSAAKRDRKNPAAARRELLATLTTLTTQQAWERLNAMITRLEAADPQRAAAFHAQRERAGVHGSTAPVAPAALTVAETRWLRTLATDLRRAVTTRGLTGDPDELGDLVLHLAGSRPRPDRWAQLPEVGDPGHRDQLVGELLNHLADQLTADQAAAAAGRR